MHGLLPVIAAITLLACGEDNGRIIDPSVDPAVGLAISPSALSLIVGGEGRFAARAFDAEDRTINASIEWSSADPAIATVRRLDGTVTAIAGGTTTVTATAGALSATASVAVIPVDLAVRLTISPSALSLIVGGEERLAARAYDVNDRTTEASFEWSSLDPAIATVGKTDGHVTAIAAGTTTVTATAGPLRAFAAVSVVAIGGSFAFTRTTQFTLGSYISDVFLFSAADPTMRSLPRSSQFASIGAPAWSTDGTRLVVEVIHDLLEEHGMVYYKSSDLYVLDAAAPADAPWRALTANGLSESPSWSPDGKRIAYVQESDIYIIDAGGGTPVRLTQTKANGAPRWSPDGARLAFSNWSVGSGDVFIVNADGSGLTNVTQSSASEYDPSWSPDGARLAFASRTPGTDQFAVSVVDVDGSNVKRLASLIDYPSAPAWSPDGRQIIFSVVRLCCARSLPSLLAPGLYVMNADGSSLDRLTTPPENSWDSAPVWRR